VKHEDLEKERKHLPFFKGLSDIENNLNHITTLEESIKTLDKNIDRLNQIKEKREQMMFQTQFIPALQNIGYPQANPLDFMGIKDLEQIRKDKNRLLILEGVVSVGLESFPHLPNINIKDHSSLEKVLNKRVSLAQTIKAISKSQVGLPEINTQVEKDLEVANQHFDLLQQILKTEQEVQRITEELEQIKCEIGDTCPLCEQGIDH
jgi:hypothetical protein